MEKVEQYNNAFIETFNVEPSDVESLEYQSIPAWDSVGHMSLIAALEEAFDIMMDTEDIIDFSSYVKGKEILVKYEVTL